MLFLNVERASRPTSGFAGPADFLFDKRGKCADQHRFPVCGTSDKVRGQLIREVFGVLCCPSMVG
ncbi:MAG: hypothetical protein ACRDIV_24480 [Ktedonobacteraceae bacterium]